MERGGGGKRILLKERERVNITRKERERQRTSESKKRRGGSRINKREM